MYALLNIPEHKNCNNCGGCCEIVMASEKEIENIRKFIKKNPNVLDETGSPTSLTCIFRDEEEKKCLIYPVRPISCRLMGVVEGMECSQGNSNDLNGRKFMSEVFLKSPRILNMMRWEE